MSFELLFVVVAIVFIIVLLLRTSGVVVLKIKLNNFTNEILRVAELEGEVGDETLDIISKLESNLNIEPTITWNTTEKVQLNQPIEVICMLDDELRVGSMVVPVTLSSKAVGRSEVYWKD